MFVLLFVESCRGQGGRAARSGALTARAPGRTETRRCTWLPGTVTGRWWRSCSRRARTSAQQTTCVTRAGGAEGLRKSDVGEGLWFRLPLVSLLLMATRAADLRDPFASRAGAGRALTIFGWVQCRTSTSRNVCTLVCNVAATPPSPPSAPSPAGASAPSAPSAGSGGARRHTTCGAIRLVRGEGRSVSD